MDRDLFTDVSIFLRETLAKEKLSEHAELCRQQLLQKLDFREASPQAYIDMNGSTKGELIETNLIHSQCYEVLSDINEAKEKEAANSNRSSAHIHPVPDNSYYNVPRLLTEPRNIIRDEIKPDILLKPLNKQSPLLPIKTNTINSDVKIEKKDTSDRISESSITTYSSSSKSDEIGEVLTISASAVRYSAVKYGLLSRKEKFFFMEHTKQYWAALLGHILYVYSNEKDNKPVFEVDIAGYQARPVVFRESNKKDSSFEVFAPGKKTYQFIAESSTEMQFWITAICKSGKVTDLYLRSEKELSSQKEIIRQLPSIPLERMLYDHPDSAVRPVMPPQHQVYEIMQEPADDLYHYIEHQPVNEIVSTENEKVIYKNTNCDEDNNLYYNLLPESESIYDVIPEKTDEANSKFIKIIPDIIETPKTENFVKDSRPNAIIIQEEIYELVN